jgi:hypothetical protein
LPTLEPEPRARRSDSLGEVAINDIKEAWQDLGAMSPNLKDVHRVRIGRGQYICDRILYIHCTGHDVWQKTKEKYPATAALIMLQDPDAVP